MKYIHKTIRVLKPDIPKKFNYKTASQHKMNYVSPLENKIAMVYEDVMKALVQKYGNVIVREHWSNITKQIKQTKECQISFSYYHVETNEPVCKVIIDIVWYEKNKKAKKDNIICVNFNTL